MLVAKLTLSLLIPFMIFIVGHMVCLCMDSDKWAELCVGGIIICLGLMLIGLSILGVEAIWF
jgi:hypothetical protein